jgi:hypothetical protein
MHPGPVQEDEINQKPGKSHLLEEKWYGERRQTTVGTYSGAPRRALGKSRLLSPEGIENPELRSG